MQTPRDFSDESLSSAARTIFEEVQAAHEQLSKSSPEIFTVEPGSLLHGDDQLSAPCQVSHGAAAAIDTAVEQLHAIKTPIIDAGILHARAPYSNVRNALEARSTALWLLDPALSQVGRVVRRMRHALQDLADGHALR